MKRTSSFFLFVLLSALVGGCSSVVHYEVRLKKPNPYSTSVVQAQKRPQSKSKPVLRFNDENGQQFQIETKYVEAVKPPPPGDEAATLGVNANYQIILTKTNIYGVHVAYTPSKPMRATQKYYLVKRMDGRELEIPSVYVEDIEAKTKDDVYEDPDPQFRKDFEYR